MRELQLWEPDAGLDETFADVETLSASCRFRDCRHEQEPGCAVKAAVEAGELDAARYDSYLQLSRERQAFGAQQAERALIDEKRQGKIGGKGYRALQKRRR
jgi:ribosome biogenesis GTPase